MRRPYPTVHIDHKSSVPFPSGSGSKPTLVCGHLPLKSSTGNSHQAFYHDEPVAIKNANGGSLKECIHGLAPDACKVCNGYVRRLIESEGMA